MSSDSIDIAFSPLNDLYYVRRTTPSWRVPHLAAVLMSVVSLMAAGCGSDSTTAAGPTPVKCQVSLANPSGVLDANGGAGLITISAQPECAWTASTPTAWIADLAPRTGQGEAQMQFRALPNPSSSTRQAEILVNDRRIEITQPAAACSVSLTPTQHDAEATGGTLSVNVSTATGCSWAATTDAAWISVTANATGTSSGTVSVVVAPNSGPQRSGRVTIGNGSVTITQTGVPQGGATPCVYGVTPTSQSVPSAGGSGSVAIQTAADCAWAAASSVAWMTVTSAGTGRGAGSVAISVAPNTGSTRTGTITVADRIVTVTQAGATSCTYTISPATESFSAAGGTGAAITVATMAECSWTVVSDTAWITVTSASTGSGNGQVTFRVAPNTGSGRSAALLIGDQRFSVVQAAAESAASPPASPPAVPSPPPPPTLPSPPTPPPPAAPTCAYTITPPNGSMPSAGGAASPVTVATANGCSWTASSDVTWLTITSGDSGAGPGQVGYTVAANAGPQRTGTLSIVTLVALSVTAQLACCRTVSVWPATVSVPVRGDPGFAPTP